jgi:quercetin dioxygenase-like cupin family protein
VVGDIYTILLSGEDTGGRFTLIDMYVPPGTTLHVPANAPHQFHNSSGEPARLLCICAAPGQEVFFAAVGDRVSGRTAPPTP